MEGKEEENRLTVKRLKKKNEKDYKESNKNQVERKKEKKTL